MNFNSKNGRKGSFSYETKASISFMSIKRMCFMVPNQENKGDYYVNPCLPQLKKEL